MTLAALIFDVDGTLAETEDVHRRAFNETFRDHGIDWHWDVALYRELLRVAGGKERMAHYVDTHHPGRRHEFGPARIAALHADKTPRYLAAVRAGGLPLRPGVRRLIDQARAAGLRLAIATTTSRANIVTLLESTLGPEGPSWFEVMACGEDAAAKKPDPAVYRVALERLGLAAADCLAIEDSVIGLRAATGAGIPTVITRSAYGLDADYDGALAVLDDLSATTLADLTALHDRTAATV